MAPQRKYHVFLSFRGPDVRNGFLRDLDEKLRDRAITTFMDDRELKRGTIIDKGLMLAIKQSTFSIVIVSKNYAESAWCLLELAHIVKCMPESGRIMPIFYGVNPRDVRHQTGSIAQHFTKHEKKHGKDGKKVRKWKDAFTKLGNLSGWDSKNYSDEGLIKEIVDLVCEKVNDPTVKGLGSTQKPVGGDGKLKKIDLLLNPEANDVRTIGIWGTDETGNNITAELVCKRNSDKFEVSRILSDIKTDSLRKGLVYLQTNLLKDLLNLKSIEVPNEGAGKEMIKKFVRGRKVLLILDDMDQRDQLKILGGDTDWYDKGSRIIVTSTDKELLVELGIKEPFLVEGLTKDEALPYYN